MFGFRHDKSAPAFDERERLLRYWSALDLGIRHYDTAPSYGYGEAEQILAEFVAPKRDQVTVTTKFGIQPPRVAGFTGLVGLARKVVRQIAPVRKVLARQTAKLVRRDAFTVADAAKSLEASLRSLHTGYIDIYLIHEPDTPEAVSDELVEFLHGQVDKGNIRCFGIGAEFERVRKIVSHNPKVAQILQFESDVLEPKVERMPSGAEWGIISHRPFGSSSRNCAPVCRPIRQ